MGAVPFRLDAAVTRLTTEQVTISFGVKGLEANFSGPGEKYTVVTMWLLASAERTSGAGQALENVGAPNRI